MLKMMLKINIVFGRSLNHFANHVVIAIKINIILCTRQRAHGLLEIVSENKTAIKDSQNIMLSLIVLNLKAFFK